jgi:hypothetical protein
VKVRVSAATDRVHVRLGLREYVHSAAVNNDRPRGKIAMQAEGVTDNYGYLKVSSTGDGPSAATTVVPTTTGAKNSTDL